jgi:hypothetical protein
MGRRRADLVLAVARLGHLHWFFGNLYESVVRMPERLAAESAAGRAGGALAPDSPARYYLPAAPFTLGATAASVAGGWHRRDDRPTLAAAALLTAGATGLSGYLIRTVNVPLMSPAVSLTAAERALLTTRWHRLNRVRLVAVAGAAFALGRVGS